LFFHGPNWQWNAFDLILVFTSLTNVSLSLTAKSATQNVAIARVLRFTRFIRIFSITRAMRAFQSLRIVVFTIFESMVSLMWCFLILGLILFTFAVFLVQGVTEQILSDPTARASVVQNSPLKFYGSVLSAMNVLFMSISGGVDWIDAMSPMKKIHWVYEWCFSLYVFFMVIGVLNVVMGAFVTRTAEIAERDREFCIREQMSQINTYYYKVKTFFQEADRDRSGKLSLEEFRLHLRNKNVSAYFRALDLDVSQAEVLFNLLDQDGSNLVSLEEFLSGCMRLKGQARSIDVNMLLHENRALSNKISQLVSVVRLIVKEYQSGTRSRTSTAS